MREGDLEGSLLSVIGSAGSVDLLSIRPGNGKCGIEVKGRARIGDIEVSANE